MSKWTCPINEQTKCSYCLIQFNFVNLTVIMKLLLSLMFLNLLMPNFGQERTENTFYGFSGQVMARVEGVLDLGVRVRVLKVNRVWKNNRVKKPNDLIQKSILIRARGNAEARNLQGAYLNGLRVGQTFPIEIRKSEENFWEILELNAEQIRVASARLETKRNALGRTSDGENNEASRALQRSNRSENSREENGAERTEVLNQLNRVKRENAELRSRVLKLESRLLRLENLMK